MNIIQLMIANYFQDGRLSEFINISEDGDFKGKQFKRFKGKARK